MTFRDTIFYSRNTLTIDEVYEDLPSKERIKHLVVRSEGQPESLVVHKRNQAMNLGGNMSGRLNEEKNKSHPPPAPHPPPIPPPHHPMYPLRRLH